MGDQLIDGIWIEGGGTELRSTNPATGELVWLGRTATESQVENAIRAAQEAFDGWRTTPLSRRIDHVRRFAALVDTERDALTRVISLETGKPRWEARTEVASMIAKVDITVQAHRERTGTSERTLDGFRSVVRHRPHGVMGVLGPYNFPGHLPNGHIVPALVAGNVVVFKPSEHTPWTAVEVAKLWERAGLPAGVLNLVVGGKETGAALVGDPDLDGLLFTGSAATGEQMHRRFSERPEAILALEMGGNNPLVIDEVDDISGAVYLIVQSAYITAGQRCTCARRLFVPRSPYGARLVERLTRVLGSLRVGAPDDPEEPFMGPVISELAADELLDAQRRLLDLGGTPLVVMRKLREGTGLLSPGLIDVTGIRHLPDEEHFGPVLQLSFYDDFQDAITQANATRFGLAAGLVSDCAEKWKSFLDEIVAGVVNWNRPLTGASSAAPFGGVGVSGNNRPSAYYAADYCAYPVASLEQERVACPATLPPGITL
jgi:succinylglutamic semialdehyde dehydrogenase